MKKYLFIFILIFFTGCVYIFEDIEYKIREVKHPDYSYETLSIKSEKEEYSVNLKISSDFKEIQMTFYHIGAQPNELQKKVLNDIFIFSTGKTIVVKKEDINYKVKKGYQDKPYLATIIKLKDPLDNKFTLRIGRVQIRDRIFYTPEIVLQQYKKVYSDSLLRTFANEVGLEANSLYQSEGWVKE